MRKILFLVLSGILWPVVVLWVLIGRAEQRKAYQEMQRLNQQALDEYLERSVL